MQLTLLLRILHGLVREEVTWRSTGCHHGPWVTAPGDTNPSDATVHSVQCVVHCPPFRLYVSSFANPCRPKAYLVKLQEITMHVNTEPKSKETLDDRASPCTGEVIPCISVQLELDNSRLSDGTSSLRHYYAEQWTPLFTSSTRWRHSTKNVNKQLKVRSGQTSVDEPKLF